MKVKKEQKDKRRVKRKSEGLKIYSPTGQLLFVGKPGFSLNYQDLLIQKRQKRPKSKYSYFKRVFRG